MVVGSSGDLGVNVGRSLILLLIRGNCTAQIRDLDARVCHDKHILGLDIAMDHPRGVDRAEAGEQLPHCVFDFVFWDGFGKANSVLEVALCEGKDEVNLVVPKGNNLLEPGDVGVLVEVGQYFYFQKQLSGLSPGTAKTRVQG